MYAPLTVALKMIESIQAHQFLHNMYQRMSIAIACQKTPHKQYISLANEFKPLSTIVASSITCSHQYFKLSLSSSAFAIVRKSFSHDARLYITVQGIMQHEQSSVLKQPHLPPWGLTIELAVEEVVEAGILRIVLRFYRSSRAEDGKLVGRAL